MLAIICLIVGLIGEALFTRRPKGLGPPRE
jgi:hypothetical protein